MSAFAFFSGLLLLAVIWLLAPRAAFTIMLTLFLNIRHPEVFQFCGGVAWVFLLIGFASGLLIDFLVARNQLDV
jgi:hypothetical protein